VITIIKIESLYHRFLKAVFWLLNPVKKIIIKTECQVHTHINLHALTILKNDKLLAPYEFYAESLEEINKGAVWADQDFKSSNHFYNPYKKKVVCTAGAMRWL
jgi:phospholipase C